MIYDSFIARLCAALSCTALLFGGLISFGHFYSSQLQAARFTDSAALLAVHQDARLAMQAYGETYAAPDPDIVYTLAAYPYASFQEGELENDSPSVRPFYAQIKTATPLAPYPVHISDLVREEFDCLTQAVYYEAGIEPTQGKLAVAEVILNRVAHPAYPGTICEVVYQGSTRQTGCQFTFTCDGALKRRPNARLWELSRDVAAHIIMGLYAPRTDQATHYHATYVDPVWNAGLIRTTQIGQHIFYRFPHGAERRRAREALAAERARRALKYTDASADRSEASSDEPEQASTAL